MDRLQRRSEWGGVARRRGDNQAKRNGPQISGAGAVRVLSVEPAVLRTRGEWSPDGSMLVFATTPTRPDPGSPPNFEPPDFHSEVYTLRNDGTGLIRITDSPTGGSGNPRWVDCSRPTAGCQARVTNVGPERLNVRKGAGLGASTVGKLREGDVICFIGPPSYIEGLKWWPLHAADGAEGWAAAYDPDAVDEPWLTPTGDLCQGEPAG